MKLFSFTPQNLQKQFEQTLLQSQTLLQKKSEYVADLPKKSSEFATFISQEEFPFIDILLKKIPQIRRIIAKKERKILALDEKHESSPFLFLVHVDECLLTVYEYIQSYKQFGAQQIRCLQKNDSDSFYKFRKEEVLLIQNIQNCIESISLQAQKFSPKKLYIAVLTQTSIGQTFARFCAICLCALSIVTTNALAQSQPLYEQRVQHEMIQKIKPFAAVVYASNLRVRSSPSLEHSHILTSISHTDVTVTGTYTQGSRVWYEIVISQNNQRGFGYIVAKDGDVLYAREKVQRQQGFSENNLEKLIDFVKKWEGFKSYAYKDRTKKGHFYAIGYGTLLDNKTTLRDSLRKLSLSKDDLLQKRVSITHDQARYLLFVELTHSLQLVRKHIQTFDELPFEIQMVLIDMMYNMGEASFQTFTNMIDAFNRHDYERAAYEAKNSHWFSQVGRRSIHHVQLIYKYAQQQQRT